MTKRSFQLKARDHLESSEGKAYFNREHFAESAPRYDLATILLSMGRDASWKRRLIRELPDRERPVCVDIACGTGDLTFLLADRYPDGDILGTDLTEEMIEIAQSKIPETTGSGDPDPGRIRFQCCDMSQLPLEDESVDILTGSYAIRNAPCLETALAEIHRVMKPGGHVAFLDFRKPDGTLPQAIQYGMLRIWGSFWGLVLHGNPEVHGYISASLRTFPGESDLFRLYEKVGFQVDEVRKPFGGMMSLHHLGMP